MGCVTNHFLGDSWDIIYWKIVLNMWILSRNDVFSGIPYPEKQPHSHGENG
jgi:hypothetical protein